MNVWVALDAAGVGVAAHGLIHGAPTMRGAGQPSDERRLPVTLKVHHEGEFLLPQEPQQRERFPRDVHNISAAIHGAVDRQDFIHITKASKERRKFLRSQKRDLRIGKIFAERMDGRQSEQDVADRFESRHQNPGARLRKRGRFHGWAIIRHARQQGRPCTRQP